MLHLVLACLKQSLCASLKPVACIALVTATFTSCLPACFDTLPHSCRVIPTCNFVKASKCLQAELSECLQAGTVEPHPLHVERHLEELAHGNTYQLALLRMHQVHYEAQPHKQSALLQVLLLRHNKCFLLDAL